MATDLEVKEVKYYSKKVAAKTKTRRSINFYKDEIERNMIKWVDLKNSGINIKGNYWSYNCNINTYN